MSDNPIDNNPSGPANGKSPENAANGLRAFETLQAFLEADGWYPLPVENKTALRMNFDGKSGNLPCYAQINVDLQQFFFYATAPVKVPEEIRPDVAEFLTRANYGLRIGNFELDYADGEVRYKTSLDFEGERLTDNFIRNAIYPAVQTMDRYLKGLMTVTFGGRTPAEAIEEVEGKTH